MSEKKDDVSDDELDQIIQDMSHEEEPEAEPAKPVADVVPMKKAPKLESTAPAATPASEQRLALEMTGVINLKLSFTQAERSVEVLCTEEALICRTADGAEFRIPTGISKARKVA